MSDEEALRLRLQAGQTEESLRAEAWQFYHDFDITPELTVPWRLANILARGKPTRPPPPSPGGQGNVGGVGTNR
jgi:hypothetical protein